MRALVCLSLALLLGLPLLAQAAREPYIVVSGEWTLPISVDGTRLTGTNSNTWASAFLNQSANEGLRSWLSAKDISYSRETYDRRSYQSDPNANVSIVTNWIRDRNPSATFQVSEVTKSSTKFSFRSSVSLGEIPGLIPLYQARWINLRHLADFLNEANIRDCSFRVGNNNTTPNSSRDRILVRNGDLIRIKKRGAPNVTTVGGSSMDEAIEGYLRSVAGHRGGFVEKLSNGSYKIGSGAWESYGYSRNGIANKLTEILRGLGADDPNVSPSLIRVEDSGNYKIITINYPSRQKSVDTVSEDGLTISGNIARYNGHELRLNQSLLSEYHYEVEFR